MAGVLGPLGKGGRPWGRPQGRQAGLAAHVHGALRPATSALLSAASGPPAPPAPPPPLVPPHSTSLLMRHPLRRCGVSVEVESTLTLNIMPQHLPNVRRNTTPRVAKSTTHHPKTCVNTSPGYQPHATGPKLHNTSR
eukprot:224337-Chlamydomonas_euryale.AAC.1